VKKYIASLNLGMQEAFEYRANFILSMVSALFPIFIQVFLWLNLYGNAQTTALFGFTLPQMLTYVLFANIIARLVRTGFEYEINRDIKDGNLNKFIIRPVSYFLFRLSAFLGQKLIQSITVSVLIIAVILMSIFAFKLPITFLNIALFLISLVFAFLLNYIIFFFVGMLGFWFIEIGFLFEAVRIVFIVFSGGVFPLDVFGETGKKVLSFFPFMYTTYFPTDIISCRIGIDRILLGIGYQIAWITILSILAKLIYRAGLKRYCAFGG
jgi:ABC-2 type transport system permease protein